MKSLIIAGRLIRQINGDKRTLAVMIIAPIMIMTLLYFLLSSWITTVNIDVVDASGVDLDALDEMADITVVSSEQEAIDRIINGDSDGYIDGDKFVVEGTDPSISAMVQKVFVSYAMAQTLSALPNGQNLMRNIGEGITVEAYYGSTDYDQFDFLAPSMMGFIIFFLVFLLSGIAFLRERISGTLERVMATSLKRRSLVGGYFLGFGVFAALQTVVIQVFLFYVLGIHTDTDFFLILLIDLIIAGTSLALGTLLSAFARNEFQLFQFIPIIIIPQMMFSGLFNLREVPVLLQGLAKVFPLNYGADALRDVMLKGQGFAQVYPDLLIMMGFTALFIVLNIAALKKYRNA